MDTFSSDDIKELAGAMLKVQAELSPAIKDASNPFAKSRYATLNSVISASREPLLNNGIWVTQYPVPVETGHLGLVTRLTHASSGQWLSCLMVMPLAKSDPQGYGSAMTYARRYSISALIGLIVEDDDAEGACLRPKNGFSANPTPASNQGESLKDAQIHEPAPSLPVLQGISYQTIQDEDGRLRVVALGNTMPYKDYLKNSGFRWNPDRKTWWRYTDSA
jgi:hypothetical protein